MIRHLALGCGLLGCVLSGGGCQTHVAPVKPAGTATLKLTAEHKVSSFTLRPLYVLALTLPSAPPAHHWAITFHDTRYLKLMSEIQSAANADEGATVSFLAVAPGRTRLRFILLPEARQRAVVPLDQQELILTIQ